MDEGLSWWNEEFWITVVINFTSVAVTIGLTVLISWWILNKQLQHDRESQAEARALQQADYEREQAIDRRIRFTGDLPEVLNRFGARLDSAVRAVRTNSHQRSVQYYQSAVLQEAHSLAAHPYRRAKSEVMYGALSEIEKHTIMLWSIPDSLTIDADDDFMERWTNCGLALSRDIFYIAEQVADWQEDDVLELRESDFVELELIALIELGVGPPPVESESEDRP